MTVDIQPRIQMSQNLESSSLTAEGEEKGRESRFVELSSKSPRRIVLPFLPKTCWVPHLANGGTQTKSQSVHQLTLVARTQYHN